MNKEEFLNYIEYFDTFSEEDLYDIGIKHKSLPLCDRNWNEVNELIGKRFLSGENYRTWIKNIQSKRGELPSNPIISYIKNPDTNKAEIELNEKIEKLKKERMKLQTVNVLNNGLTRENSRFELLYETIAERIEQFPLPKDFEYIEPTEEDMHYVLCFSDIHYGTKFTSINNKYSIEEVENRFNKLFNDTVKFVQDKNINNLSIIDLGDDINGILRLSALQTNQIPVVEAVIGVSRLIANFLNKLSAYVNINYFHTCYANHSQMRPLGTKASELASEDLGKIIFNYIKDMLANNNNITVYGDPEKDYLSFFIYDFNIFVQHGHQIKNIEDAIKDLNNLHNNKFSYLLVGHTHSQKEIVVGEGTTYNIEVLTSPSIIGSDPYADSLYKGSKAGAKIFGFDRINGHVEDKIFILN